MANKKEKKRSFLNAPLPQENKKYKSTRTNWGGLNLSNTYNSGQLSYADGVSVSHLPYIQTDTVLEDVNYNNMSEYNKDGYKILGAYQNDDLYVIVYSVNTIKLCDDGYPEVNDNDDGKFYVKEANIDHKMLSSLLNITPKNGEYSVYADVYVKKFNVYSVKVENNEESYSFDRTEEYKKFRFVLAQYPLFVGAYNETEPFYYYKYYYNRAFLQGEKYFTAYKDAWDFCKKNFDLTALRNISLFGIYDNPADPVGSDISKKLLVFPDKYTMPTLFEGLDITVNNVANVGVGNGNFLQYYGNKKKDTLYYCNITQKGDEFERYTLYDTKGENDEKGIITQCDFLGTYPDIIKAVPKDSRLYGITKSEIYVSGFNNYADMNLDTVLYSNSAGAWMVTTKASEESTGVFTAIYPFSGCVVAFKEDFMYTVTGSTNPFKLNEIGDTGCVDMRSICDEDGRLYFASKNGIYVYRNGYLPTCISEPVSLEFENITSAVAYMENHRYHVNIGGTEYIYDTRNGAWTKNTRGFEAVAVTGKDIIASDNRIYTQSKEYRHNWKFKTDYKNSFSSDTKSLCKLQLMYEIFPSASVYIYIQTDEEDNKIIYRSDNPYRESKIKCARVLLRLPDLVNYSVGVGGSGFCKIHSLEMITENTVEVYE